MEPKRFRATASTGPEQQILEDITSFLRTREWYVKRIPASSTLAGLPDLFATHRQFRQRWIEVKDPKRRSGVYTPAQLDTFPLLVANGSPVWTLVAATEDEYKKLFQPCNWHLYLDIMRVG